MSLRSRFAKEGDVSENEVSLLLERLLISIPELGDFGWIERNAGFSYSTILALKTQIGEEQKNITSSKLSSAIYPYLDLHSWTKVKPSLESIIQNPKKNPFTLQEILKNDSLWWNAMMGFLSSKNVRFNGYELSIGKDIENFLKTICNFIFLLSFLYSINGWLRTNY